MTGLDVYRPGFLWLLAMVPALALVWRRWPPPLTPGRSRTAFLLHSLVIFMLVLALAEVRMSRRAQHRATIAVVDQSDSVLATREQAVAAVRAMIDSKDAEDLFGVVTFGRDAQVEMPPTARPTFSGFQTRPDPTYSDLGGALELAANLIPGGYARHVVLVSDGRQNLGDAAAVVAELRDRSVRVDVFGMGDPGSGEAMVLALEAPPELRPDQDLTVTARLRSSVPGTGKVTLQVDGVETVSRAVDLPAGVSDQTFELGVIEGGTHEIGVVLDAGPDGYSENNTALAVVKVLGRPNVLLLEGSPGSGANVRAALDASGMATEVRRARDAPTDLAVLSRFDVVVVADAQIEDFPEGSLAAVQTAVRDLGRGLVTTGGPRSYGPGGWENTVLEEMLPVRMQPRKMQEKPSVAVVVAVETMENPFGDGVALGAIQSVLDQLGPDDEFGVINMSHELGKDIGADASSFLIPLSRLSDPLATMETVQSTRLGDPPSYSPSLAMATAALSESGAATKHVIIIGDGDALGDVGQAHAAGAVGLSGLPDYDSLLAATRAARITVSSIGVDTHRDQLAMEHMRAISTAGGGRFFEAETAQDVPKALLAESRSTLRPWYELTPFFARVTSSGDLLAGVPLDAFPQLGGYVVTTPKPSADVALSSPPGDPVLASIQYGLGRTVAWTPDAEGRWTSGFLKSPVSSELFARMVSWALPAGSADPVRIDARPSGDGLDVTVTGPAEGGELELRVVSPTGQATIELLRPVGAGSWQGVIDAADTGKYHLRAVVTRAGSVVGNAEVTMPVPYSPEYREVGRDEAVLGHLAGFGGAVLADPTSAWTLKLPPLSVTSPVFWWLVLLAAIVWPLDVALRRLTLSPAKIAGLVRVERAVRRRVAAAVPDGASRLRQGVEARKDRRGRGDPSAVDDGKTAGRDSQDDEAPAPPGKETALATRLLEARRGGKADD